MSGSEMAHEARYATGGRVVGSCSHERKSSEEV